MNPMPAELKLTPCDEKWLRDMDRAMQPTPMVSADMYCAAIAANEYITGENHRLRKQLRQLHWELGLWRGFVLALGLAAGAFAAWRFLF